MSLRATKEFYNRGYNAGYYDGKNESKNKSAWGSGIGSNRPCLECGHRAAPTKFCPECGRAMVNPWPKVEM